MLMIVSRCTHGGTSISPTDNPNKIVLTCGAALHCERSPTVTLASILSGRSSANHIARDLSAVAEGLGDALASTRVSDGDSVV